MAESSGPPPAVSSLPAALRGFAWKPGASFLGLGAEDSSWESASHLLVPVPYEATTSYGRGTGEGPAAILEASRHLELYDEELDDEPCRAGICTLPALELPASGPERAMAELGRLYDVLLEEAGDRFAVTLGGEHTVSSGPALAWQRRLGGDLSVLQLDAHTDLRDRFQDTPWSHACVMRRILDGGTRSVVSVGIRSLSAPEREVLDREEVTVVWAEELRESAWVEKALDALGDPVYVTFDMDFFDPGLVPGTGTPEPGGGGWWQALDLLRAVFRTRRVVGADVVELAPEPTSKVSSTVAAKLVYKLIGYRERY